MKKIPKFAQQGLAFECTACGKCCENQGEYAEVYLTFNDIKKLAKELKLSKKDFLKKLTFREDDETLLKSNQHACIFLGEDKKCMVYQARPVQCQTFPFWPENLTSKVWNEELASYCPGINKGEKVDPKEILKQVQSLGSHD